MCIQVKNDLTPIFVKEQKGIFLKSKQIFQELKKVTLAGGKKLPTVAVAQCNNCKSNQVHYGQISLQKALALLNKHTLILEENSNNFTMYNPYTIREASIEKLEAELKLMNKIQYSVLFNSSNASSSLASRASSSSTSSSSAYATTDDMPQWKRNMLERQKKEEEAKAAVTSGYTSR